MGADYTIRKFVDLVLQTSGKWPNLDPPIPVDVGDYGTLNEKGELDVEGNIYDAEFQAYLVDKGFKLDLNAAENQAQLGDVEENYIVASSGVKRGEFKADQSINIPGIASASIKGAWKFKDGKRGVLIILSRIRQKFIPRVVKTAVLKVDRLNGKKLVTSAIACPAYLLCLSSKSGDTVSVALCAQTATTDAVTSGFECGWWTDNESAHIRRAFNHNGEHRFIPLYALQEKARIPIWRRWRGEEETDANEDHNQYEWQDTCQPWKPLDEDGEEVIDDD